MGEDWVYVSFELGKDCSRFKTSKIVRSYFSVLRPVVNGFLVKERVIWIEILGLPCCAWNDDVVSKVVKLWGEVCFLEEDNEAPLAVKRVCIKTLKPSIIHDKIKVIIQGINYDIGARELSNWEP